MSGGARPDAADTKSAPEDDDETPSTAADIRALAEQAEAEAAEAEALAAAARARARAIQLRRKAELIEHAAATPEETRVVSVAPATPAAAPEAAAAGAEVGATEEDEPDEAETVHSEEKESQSKDHADEAEETEEVAVATQEKPLGLGRMRRLRRRPTWSTIAAAVAFLIIVAALAGSGYMIKEHHDADRKRQLVAEFAAAARQGVVTLTTADFNNAKQSVQHILDNATGSFKDDMLKTADDFVKVIEQAKVVERGTVQAAAVDRDTMTNDSAVVLVAATSEVTNAAGAKQEPRTYRLIVTVARDGGQLKISKVEFVP